jgi:hypothetical protein
MRLPLRRSLPLVFLLACSTSSLPLGPSQPVASDEMVTALAADATFVAGFDVDDAILDEVVPPDILGPIGLVPEDLRRWRLGCGDAGCAALVEGDLSGVAWQGVNDLPGLRQTRTRVRAIDKGVDITDHTGERFVLRVLSPTKAVVGDLRAVRQLAEAAGARHDGGDVGFDGSALSVPSGQLWFAAQDPTRFADQVSRRLAHRDTQRAREGLAALHAAMVEHPRAAAHVVSIAAAVHSDARVTVALRGVFSDVRTARFVERAARRALHNPPEEAAVWLDQADEVVVAREDAITEVRISWDPEVLR